MSAPPLERAAPPEGTSTFADFGRETWADLRAATPLPLSEAELDALQSADEYVSMREVTDVYLPLSRLLNLHVVATQALHRVTDTFLGRPSARTPYVIGIAGSVAVGKSTTARLLQALLARWPDHPNVDLVTTDGFLYPNRVLRERGLMQRKGFPESYDLRRLVRFLAEVKSGGPAEAPVYSHLTYDVVADRAQTVDRPDVLIVEGLNVLQSGDGTPGRAPRVFVSDFFDFSIYVDAPEEHLREWFLRRFLRLRATAFQDPASYFRTYAALPEPEADRIAREVWDGINGPNLRENILPTRERARLILEKGPDHRVERIRLRRV